MIPQQNHSGLRLVVLGGKACSGKSTIGMALARNLGAAFLSMGNFSREFARETQGLDIRQFQELCLKDPTIDRRLDEAFCARCREAAAAGGAVVDFRLGGHFFPDAFKAFLEVSDEVAAERGANRGDETLESLRCRNQAMRDRLKATYGYDFTDTRNYDRVLKVDNLTVSAAAETLRRDVRNAWGERETDGRFRADGIWRVDFGSGLGSPWPS